MNAKRWQITNDNENAFKANSEDDPISKEDEQNNRQHESSSFLSSGLDGHHVKMLLLSLSTPSFNAY